MMMDKNILNKMLFQILFHPHMQISVQGMI
jgi:hypothetical protein